MTLNTHLSSRFQAISFASVLALTPASIFNVSALAQQSAEEPDTEEQKPRPEIFCHDAVFLKRKTRIALDYDKKAWDLFEIGPDHVITETPDLDAFQNAVKNLPQDRWKTPQAIWPVQSIKVNIKLNGISACNIIYTRSKLYSQYSDQKGFVMQPISDITFRRLTDTLFTITIE